MSIRLVLNPVSGSDDALAELPRLNERLRARFGHLDIVLTASPGDAERAGLRAARDGGLVVVGGGDGTLNDVLNGLRRGGGLDRVRVAVLPLGTGNDFATALGTPSGLDEALEGLGGGGEALIDLGCANDRVFANVSAGGFVAEASESVSPAMKTVAGRLAYMLGGAQVLVTWTAVGAEFASAGPVLALDGDGTFVDSSPPAGRRPVQLFAVCNSPLIGGGRPIAPAARIDDGWLDVCVVDEMPTMEFVTLLGRVAAGRHLDDPRVHYLRVRDLEVRLDRTVKVNVDGQVFEASTCRYGINAAGPEGSAAAGDRLTVPSGKIR